MTGGFDPVSLAVTLALLALLPTLVDRHKLLSMASGYGHGAHKHRLAKMKLYRPIGARKNKQWTYELQIQNLRLHQQLN